MAAGRKQGKGGGFDLHFYLRFFENYAIIRKTMAPCALLGLGAGEIAQFRRREAPCRRDLK